MRPNRPLPMLPSQTCRYAATRSRAINTDEVFGTHRDQVLDVFRDANEPLTPKSVTEQLESVTNSAGGVTVTVTLFALCGSQNPQQNGRKWGPGPLEIR